MCPYLVSLPSSARTVAHSDAKNQSILVSSISLFWRPDSDHSDAQNQPVLVPSISPFRCSDPAHAAAQGEPALVPSISPCCCPASARTALPLLIPRLPPVLDSVAPPRGVFWFHPRPRTRARSHLILSPTDLYAAVLLLYEGHPPS